MVPCFSKRVCFPGPSSDEGGDRVLCSRPSSQGSIFHQRTPGSEGNPTSMPRISLCWIMPFREAAPPQRPVRVFEHSFLQSSELPDRAASPASQGFSPTSQKLSALFRTLGPTPPPFKCQCLGQILISSSIKMVILD